MAAKQTYFYKINLYETNGNKEVQYTDLKPLLCDIIGKNGKTLDLSPSNESVHVIMDVIKYKSSKLFCRLSRQRPNNTMLQRNYITYVPEKVFDDQEAAENGIEMYTYGHLDYGTGIFSMVKAMGAPTEKALCSLFNKYQDKYYVTLTEIPNKDAINTLYAGEEPSITKLEIEIPVPSANVLEEVFGWTEDEIMKALMEQGNTASIVIKTEKRKKLIADAASAKKVIDLLKSKLLDYKRAKVTGKNKATKAREFDFFAEYFSYPIEIPTTHIDNGEKVDYSVEELADIFEYKIHEVFEANKTLIKMITDR